MIDSIVITSVVLAVCDTISKAELFCYSFYTLHRSSNIIVFFNFLRLIYLIFPYILSRWLIVYLLIVVYSISSIRTTKSVFTVNTFIGLNSLCTVDIAYLRMLIDMIDDNPLTFFFKRSNIILFMHNCGIFIFQLWL